MQTNIEERVKNEISVQMCVPIAAIRNDENLYHDFGADSLDLVELVMAIEDKFGIAISDEDAEKIQTVRQAIDYVTAKVSA